MDEEDISDFEIFENEKKESSDEEKEESESDVNEDEFLDESDDEGPEDVTFHKGKEDAMAQIQGVLSQIKGEKQREKFQKQQLHLRNLQQKEEKLSALAKRKLPDNFLQELSEKPQSKSKKKKDSNAEVNEKIDSEDAAFIEEEYDNELDDDFIALTEGDSGVKPVVLKSVQKVAAEDFKKKMMFGNHIERIPTDTMIREKSKRQFLSTNRKILTGGGKVKKPCKNKTKAIHRKRKKIPKGN